MSNFLTSGVFRMPEPMGPSFSQGGQGRDFKKRAKRESIFPNILVVEDDIEMINFFELIKNEKEWPLEIAKTSSEALALLANKNFDAIILDWNLPDFNGDTLIKLSDQLIDDHCQKHNYQLLTRIPIVTFSGEKEKNLDLSWSKYFHHVEHWGKPVKFDKLKAECERLVYTPRENEESSFSKAG